MSKEKSEKSNPTITPELEERTEQSSEYVITDEECRENYGLGLTDAELLRHRFVAMVSQIAERLQNGAFSVVIRDMQDFGIGILAPHDPADDLHMDLVASAEGCPIHFFNLQYKARNNIREYGIDNLEPGDILVYNDVYRGGSHVMDNQVAAPVFHDDELVAFINIDGHFTDIGGSVAGGFAPGITDMYSEGLRLSPRLLFEGGEPVKETFDLYLDNLRTPEITFGDLQNYGSTLLEATELLEDLCEQEGAETVRNAMQYTLDYGERRMRAALDELPDGYYEGEDQIDDDGVNTDQELKVKTALKVRGDHAEVDFSGSSAQVQGNINGSPSDLTASAHIGLMSLLLNDVHVSAGMFRAVDVLLPTKSIVQAAPPAATTQGHLVPSAKAISAIQNTLSEEISGKGVAESYNDVPTVAMSGWDGRGDEPEFFLIFQVPYGPFGGTSENDGHCYSLQIMGNCREMAYEIEEELYPHVVLRKEFVRDSAGAGEHRGGPAIRWDQMVRFDSELTVSLEQMRQETMGVEEGKGGDPAYIFEIDMDKWDSKTADQCYPADGGRTPAEYRNMISGVIDTETGEIDLENGEYHTGKFSDKPLPAEQPFATVVAGGGGFGDPYERDPEAVREDVRDDLVSIEAAKEEYGVVIDPDSLEIDYEATEGQRAEGN